MIRQPLIVFMGNVDAGKTQTLDTIRHTAIVKSEPGQITQMISSSIISLDIIKKICGKLLENKKVTVPGIVCIDTPGHAAFTNLRKRGGNLADLAVLVIDVNEGIKAQTIECLEILKQYKTPFLIALNKIDLISGWQSKTSITLLDDISSQGENIKKVLDVKLYEIVAKLYNRGFNAERFDRVEDYTKQLTIVPCSAKTGEGIPELLMVLIGLAQKFLEQQLQIETDSPGKGTVMEVKEEKGLGTAIDLILYDGKIKKDDTIVIGGLEVPIVTKIKAIFQVDKKKLAPINEAYAAAGVRVVAPGLKEVISGMPLMVANKNLEEAKAKIQEEVEEVVIGTDNEGIIIKADSLGSLEALIKLLKENNILIKKASIGDVSKKDLADAASEQEIMNKVVLGFNVNCNEKKEGIKVICHNVIYKLIEDYNAWIEEEKKKLEAKQLEGLVRPCKIRIMPGCIFRQNNPAVVGVEVLGGILKNTTPLIKKDGSNAGRVKSMQSEKENLNEAEKGKEVAISIPGMTVGRQIKEEDTLYSDLTEEEFRKLKELKKHLKLDEVDVLKEIAEIKRKEKALWGV